MAQRARSLRLINIIKTKSFFFSSAQPLVSEILRNRAKKKMYAVRHTLNLCSRPLDLHSSVITRVQMCALKVIISSNRWGDMINEKKREVDVCVWFLWTGHTVRRRHHHRRNTSGTFFAVLFIRRRMMKKKRANFYFTLWRDRAECFMRACWTTMRRDARSVECANDRICLIKINWLNKFKIKKIPFKMIRMVYIFYRK